MELFSYAVILTSTGFLQVEVLDLRLHQSLLLLSRDLLLVSIKVTFELLRADYPILRLELDPMRLLHDYQVVGAFAR